MRVSLLLWSLLGAVLSFMSFRESSMVALTSCEGLPGAYVLYELLNRGYRVKVPVAPAWEPAVLQNLWKAVYGRVPSLEGIRWLDGSLQDWASCEVLVEGSDYLLHTPDLFALGMKATPREINAYVRLTSQLVDLASGSSSLKKLIYVSSTAAFSRADPDEAITTRLPWKDHRHNTLYNKALMKAELEIWRGSAEGLNTAILNPGYMIGYSTGPSILTVVSAFKGPLKGCHGFVDVRDVACVAVDLLQADYTGFQEFLIAENLSFEVLRNLARKALPEGFANRKTPTQKVQKEGWLRFLNASRIRVASFLLQDFSMALSFKNEAQIPEIHLKHPCLEASVTFFADVIREV